MNLPETASNRVEPPMLPTEYVKAIERETSVCLLDRMNSLYATFQIRNGFPELVEFDKEGYTDHLRNSGVPEAEVELYLALISAPDYNETNRRGFDRVRSRVSA